jgi:hypothetical protein
MNTPDNDLPELDAGLRAIVRAAGELPPLTPSRDLWSGIEARIQAPVIALPVHARPAALPAVQPAGLPLRRLAIAASLLIAATAGVTYSLVKRNAAAEVAASSDSASIESRVPAASARLVALPTAEQTFDREIGAMRTIIDERRKDLDPATISVLEKNLKLIDAAIAESKAALAKDPASAFLNDLLTHAYDTKLQLLRGVATIPSHG